MRNFFSHHPRDMQPDKNLIFLKIIIVNLLFGIDIMIIVLSCEKMMVMIVNLKLNTEVSD